MNEKKAILSRRRLLKTGAAAAAGGAALVTQGGSLFGQSPAVVTGRRFRGWVTRGGGTNRTTLQELTLRPVTGRQLVVRTEATNLCYSNVGAVLGLQPAIAPAPVTPPAGGQAPGAATPPAPGGRGGTPQAGQPAAPGSRAGGPPAGGRGGGPGGGRALIQGHGGVGVVEAVGPEVRRVQVGDRVCVSGTPQCGACYQCLRGRADMCQFLGRQGANDLVAHRRDARRHAGLRQLAHRRACRTDGDLRGVGRADLHEGHAPPTSAWCAAA